jgi:manganese/zinc/iron transport system permease protein
VTPIELEIQAIAVVVAVSCALPGVFLVLRRMSLMSDAISHTVLLGIVLTFFLVGSITSALLLLGAAATGVLTVALVETVRRTRLVREDASIGLVFPALFSIAVILIARFAGNVHLDTDAVLLGEVAFAPFRRLRIGGVDIGPRTLYVMGGVLLLNAAFISALYKELKITTFDPELAAALGFPPALLHYGFMSLVSITAVGAFDAVGSVLVVALMIAPPAAAYLLSDRLPVVLVLAMLLAAVSALAGFWAAWLADASIAGSMALMAGVVFLGAFLFAPGRGVVAQARRRSRQRVDFAQIMLAIHLLQHENTPAAAEECRVTHLSRHLHWAPQFALRIVRRAEEDAWIRRAGETLLLTEEGRQAARAALAA